MLSVGIVGLPNVGKSTLFNALTQGDANVSNYPFTTIDSNLGVVAVPDRRLDELARIIEPVEVTPSRIEFIDIAGLVEGASRGEGLGNQFLDAIRQVDALVHVLRSFEDGEVTHVFANIDSDRDAEIVETELLLADLQILERAVEKRRQQWQTDPQNSAAERHRLEQYLSRLEDGKALRGLHPSNDDLQEMKSLGLLTGKPLLYVMNISEREMGSQIDPPTSVDGEFLGRVEASGCPVVSISAKLEAELAELEPAEREVFVQELGLGGSGLENLITRSFELLDLIRFYTLANRKLRAWEIEASATAPEAAGKIHTDMQQGFVRAQVAPFELVREEAGFRGLQKKGLLRTEGKTYQVQDGDVIEFAFTS